MHPEEQLIETKTKGVKIYLNYEILYINRNVNIVFECEKVLTCLASTASANNWLGRTRFCTDSWISLKLPTSPIKKSELKKKIEVKENLPIN